MNPSICPTCKRAYKRTLPQNDMMWPILHELEVKATWHGEKLKDYEWKDLLTAGYIKHKRGEGQRIVRGIDGGLVMLGAHTSRFSKTAMAEFLDMVLAFASEHGIDIAERAA